MEHNEVEAMDIMEAMNEAIVNAVKEEPRTVVKMACAGLVAVGVAGLILF